MDLANKVLLAISHSFNFIIYCFSFKNFRKIVCLPFIRLFDFPESTSEVMVGRERLQIFEDEMRNMREALLVIHRAIETPGEYRQFIEEQNDTTCNDDLSLANVKTRKEYILGYLDLAIRDNVETNFGDYDQDPRMKNASVSKSCFILNSDHQEKFWCKAVY